jgi:hypothetical protein
MAIVAGIDFGTLSVRVTLLTQITGGWERLWPIIRYTVGAKIRIMPRSRTPTR